MFSLCSYCSAWDLGSLGSQCFSFLSVYVLVALLVIGFGLTTVKPARRPPRSDAQVVAKVVHQYAAPKITSYHSLLEALLVTAYACREIRRMGKFLTQNFIIYSLLEALLVTAYAYREIRKKIQQLLNKLAMLASKTTIYLTRLGYKFFKNHLPPVKLIRFVIMMLMVGRANAIPNHNANAAELLNDKNESNKLIYFLIFMVVFFTKITRVSSKRCENKDQKKKLRIGLLNINSIGQERNGKSDKLDWIHNFLSKDQVSILAITEYINQENCPLNSRLMNHDKFPILTHNDVKRVGLAIPEFLRTKFTIDDQFFLTQDRKQKSDKIVQILTVSYKNDSVQFTLSICYFAPDITVQNREKAFDKIIEYKNRYKNYIAVGDINFDQKITANRISLNTYFENTDIHQIVDKVTRHCEKNCANGDKIVTNTIIDLVFISNELKSFTGNPKIDKKTPSDHYLVYIDLDFKVPDIYTTFEKRLDPTRRPKFKNDRVLQYAKDKLKNELKNFENKHRDSTMTECHKAIECSLVKVLDKFCPMNKNEAKTIKVYRKRRDKPVIVSKNRIKFRLGQVRKIKRKLLRDPNNTHLKSKLDHKLNILKWETKRYKSMLKNLNKKVSRDEGNKIINDPLNMHKYINSFKQVSKKSFEGSLQIDGKSGSDLVEHMAKYTHRRALLVSDKEIEDHAEYIPYPKGTYDAYDNGDFIFNHIPVKELYFRKIKHANSLACGHDTISFKHISDLWEVLEPPLQFMMNKPLDGFYNIETNITKYIPKGTLPKDKSKWNEKITRPICEANILSKYGPIRAFIDSVADEMIPKLNKNQYSLKGRGTLAAVFDLLDNAHENATLRLPMLVAIWDFSNAYCTFAHDVLLKLLSHYNMDPRKIELFGKFLNQTGTQIKMNDDNGYYTSELYYTRRGGPQGQIGIDFCFIITNDGLNPIKIEIKQVAIRTKFVDDWTDNLVAQTVSKLIELFETNVDHLLKGATSVGLKLNDDKTQLIPVHCQNKLDQFPDYYDKEDFGIPNTIPKDQIKYKFVKEAKILGLVFSMNHSPKPYYPNVSRSVENIIEDLHQASGMVACSRKSYGSLAFRIKIASAAIYSRLKNFGVIYTYSTQKEWENVCTAIRTVVKSTGLDRQTPREIVYGLSLGMEPKHFAQKLLIVIMLKKWDIQKLKDKRCLFKIDKNIQNRPNQLTAAKAFNDIDAKTRVKIVNYLLDNPNDDKRYEKVKNWLKEYFTNLLSEKNKCKNKEIFTRQNLKKYKYSYKKVNDRIKKSEILKKKKERNNLLFNEVNDTNDKNDFGNGSGYSDPDVRIREVNRVTRKRTRKK